MPYGACSASSSVSASSNTCGALGVTGSFWPGTARANGVVVIACPRGCSGRGGRDSSAADATVEAKAGAAADARVDANAAGPASGLEFADGNVLPHDAGATAGAM